MPSINEESQCLNHAITVVKGEQKKSRSSFAFVYSFSYLLHMAWSVSMWPITKHKSRRVGPASEAGGLIDYSCGPKYGLMSTYDFLDHHAFFPRFLFFETRAVFRRLEAHCGGKPCHQNKIFTKKICWERGGTEEKIKKMPFLNKMFLSSGGGDAEECFFLPAKALVMGSSLWWEGDSGSMGSAKYGAGKDTLATKTGAVEQTPVAVRNHHQPPPHFSRYPLNEKWKWKWKMKKIYWK